MLRASFVPPKPVRQLRDLTHLRTTMLQLWIVPLKLAPSPPTYGLKAQIFYF
jgi:hypothetical protein